MDEAGPDVGVATDLPPGANLESDTFLRAMDRDDFVPFNLDHAPPEALLSFAHRDSDPFADLASGDPARTRGLLLRIACRMSALTPFVADDGLTLLHAAARFDQREAAATLLRWGVPVDALTWPFRHLHDSRSRVLVGLRPQLHGARGLTPLHLALSAGHEPMVRFLLARGANPLRVIGVDCGAEGFMPLDLVEELATETCTPALRHLLLDARQRADVPGTNAWMDTGLDPGVRERLMAVTARAISVISSRFGGGVSEDRGRRGGRGGGR